MTRHASFVASVTPSIAGRSFRTSDGVRLNVLEAGDGMAGSPVIALVPGWRMPAFVWHSQLLSLGTRFRVAALDPRGQGESEVPRGGYTIDRRADDLHEFLSRYPAAIVVGWSLAALEALHCIHRHGDAHLRALVLVDSSVGEDPAPPSAAEFLKSLRSDAGPAIDRFVRGLFRRPPGDLDVDRLCEAAMRMDVEDSLSLFPAHLPREHWRQLARGLRKPLLYAVTPQFAEQARHLKRHRPATRVEVFESAGHALFVDEAPRFNRLLEQFALTVSTPAES